MKCIPARNFFFFLLMMFLGFTLMLSSRNFILLFLALECQSFSMYILLALRYKDRMSTEAAMKYFILGSYSVIMFLLGACYMYLAIGSLDFEILLSLSVSILPYFSGFEFYLMQLSIVLLTCSFLFKIGAVPFHFWISDVYSGAPFIIMFLFFLLPKFSIILFILYFFPVILQVFYDIWHFIFAFSAIFSILIGSFLAISQWKFKKLLIYSSIVNVGFVMLSLASGAVDVLFSSLFYIIAYLLTIFILFLLLLFSVASRFEVSNLKGFYNFLKMYPVLGMCFLLNLFSSAGIPPLLLFYPKIFIIAQFIGGNLLCIYTLILVAILTTFTIFYYIRVARFFFKLSGEENFSMFSLSKTPSNTFVFHYAILFLTFLQVVFNVFGEDILLPLFFTIAL